MEREGMTMVINRLSKKLNVSEVVTDACGSIIKRVRDMKETKKKLSDIHHSLDVWHKAKAINKALQKKQREKERKICSYG